MNYFMGLLIDVSGSAVADFSSVYLWTVEMMCVGD